MTARSVSSSAEDYLKHLYTLGQRGKVNTQALADALGVVPASATGMLRKLSVLRRQSLIGDTVAHAALPGICAAFLLTGTLGLLLGAGVSGLAASLLALTILRSRNCA